MEIACTQLKRHTPVSLYLPRKEASCIEALMAEFTRAF